jgi:DNA invertase Pin-like site-specific DNA recombinase
VSEPLLSPKLRPWHLDRLAIVYVRQSTAQQVLDHRESTARQYALADRAVVLGWPRDRVVTIDDDLGKSGQSIEGRPGFQRLLAEVALDHVGLILGLEMSRLARCCKDWHHLLELCGRYRLLLADADGIYDPTEYSDRLLLGLHGVMNEAELHVLTQRMYQGKLNKARRGELFGIPPIGYIRLASGEWAIDPDEQVQAVVRLIFDQFDREATLHGLLRYLVHHQIRIPVRVAGGPNKGQLEWRRPNRATLQNLLRHPSYAGAYRFGHRPTDPRKKQPGRPSTGKLIRPPEECLVLLRDRLPLHHVGAVRGQPGASGGQPQPAQYSRCATRRPGAAGRVDALRPLRAAHGGPLRRAEAVRVVHLHTRLGRPWRAVVPGALQCRHPGGAGCWPTAGGRPTGGVGSQPGSGRRGEATAGGVDAAVAVAAGAGGDRG